MSFVGWDGLYIPWLYPHPVWVTTTKFHTFDSSKNLIYIQSTIPGEGGYRYTLEA